MKLVAAWVRSSKTLRQLVVVSDSLGGEVWDWCPKVAALGRPATIAAVAGDLVLGVRVLTADDGRGGLETGN